MAKYVYLMGSGFLCLISFAMVARRRDLVPWTLLYGSIGGLVQVATSFLYVRDYWRPPTVFGTAVSIEDFLFGFGVTAFPFLAYPVFAKKKFTPSDHPARLGVYLGFALVAALVLFGGTLALGWNSLVVSLVLLAAFTLCVCAIRPDLVKGALFAVGIVTACLVPVYVLMFDVIAPGWWDRYWLLAGSGMDQRFFGDVPVLELLCYITWSGFAATGHPFIVGHAFAARDLEPRAQP
ncbi:hypothetical protein VA596_31785 [Amycolatopsis sp., V23-08]|uniref:Lycopene cyclase domain-containing protein n=1 Tax=Amycolatopsis heterodermiae TaxID=3110235 RepID=A0ABU5RD33_9PSEU|nr:hypothetical protein [Amycolatopsis sp., V23-08]MEA5364153.1 hypothetical protein [Amycolatopsis sp., V23-08]